MQPNNRSFIQVLLGFTIIVLGGVALFLGLRVVNQDTSIDDSSAAENNCCNLPDCTNFGGDWVAGYEACVRGECQRCQGGAIQCNNDTRCDAGENETNCPSDCDAGGFSQIAIEGRICNPRQGGNGLGMCDERLGLGCVTCPAGTNNADSSFCSSSYRGGLTPNDSFISQYCGGSNTPVNNCGNNVLDNGEQCDPPGSQCSIGRVPGICSRTCTCNTDAPTDSSGSGSNNGGSSQNGSGNQSGTLPNTAISTSFFQVVFGSFLIGLGFYFFFRRRVSSVR